MITTTETADKTDGTSSDEGLRPEPNETDSSKGSDRDEVINSGAISLLKIHQFKIS